MYPPSLALRLAQERQAYIEEGARSARTGLSGRRSRLTAGLLRLLRRQEQPALQVQAEARPVLVSTRS